MGNQSNNKSTLLSSAGFLLACLLVYGINRIGAPNATALKPTPQTPAPVTGTNIPAPTREIPKSLTYEELYYMLENSSAWRLEDDISNVYDAIYSSNINEIESEFSKLVKNTNALAETISIIQEVLYNQINQ